MKERMRMIRNGWIIVMLATFLALPLNIHAAQPAADSAPRALLPESEYNFGKVVEGTQVQHEFLLKNQGKGSLQILKVEAG
jgi:hypothetical protein